MVHKINTYETDDYKILLFHMTEDKDFMFEIIYKNENKEAEIGMPSSNWIIAYENLLSDTLLGEESFENTNIIFKHFEKNMKEYLTIVKSNSYSEHLLFDKDDTDQKIKEYADTFTFDLGSWHTQTSGCAKGFGLIVKSDSFSEYFLFESGLEASDEFYDLELIPNIKELLIEKMTSQKDDYDCITDFWLSNDEAREFVYTP